MEDKLIEYSTAKLAKEKGFNEECYFTYAKMSKEYCIFKSEYPITNSEIDKYIYSAPTQSLLQRWLREIHDIHIITKPYIESLGKKEITGYYIPTICTSSLDEHIEFYDNYSTYEEALEMGLQEALKLIPNNL